MATESVAEILPSLPESDIDQEAAILDFLPAIGAAWRYYPRYQKALSVPNTQSIYQSQLILNIPTVASANTLSVPRHAICEELNRRNRCQELKRYIQRHTSRIRSSRWCIFGLILLMVLPVSAMIITKLVLRPAGSGTPIAKKILWNKDFYEALSRMLIPSRSVYGMLINKELP
ncbi:uncharacterized protein TNIN_477421 [Trichonephila inaurata madagascariensis]|uniref:Uncharacterized protein n=1 Tax=Trichonephila inaurata madagascariensis TaxID=2747483 RepID=A0A8X6XXE6_9ARAC|nr:uncharacterized protein TNIN_477421 [Trichonephila inaurata madagascariensis]